MKKIKKLCISAILIFVISFCYKNCFAADYQITDYKIHVKIMEDASLHVEEYIEYDFDSSMNGLFRDILYRYQFFGQKDNMKATSSRYQASQISNIEAYYSDTGFDHLRLALQKDESYLFNGMNGYFSVEDYVDNGYRTKIKLYSPVSSGNKKYVKYVYDIEDVTVLYQNACELYWNFIGGDWECSIQNLEIKIDFESLNSMQGVLVYPHSYSSFETKIVDDSIYITADYLPASRALDARIVFPRVSTYYSSKNVEQNYDFDELDQIETKMNFDKIKYHISNVVFVVIFVVGVIFFIVVIIASVKVSSKGRKKKKELAYFRDIPEKYSLDMYHLMLGSSNTYSSNSLFLATLLDLVNKKYILMNAKKKEKKGLMDKIDYEYFMELNKEADYSKLTKYEILILNFLFNEKAEFGINIAEFKNTSIELNEQLKELTKKHSLSNKLILKYKMLDSDKEDKIYDKAPKWLKRFSLITGLILGGLLFINLFFVSPLNFDLKMENFGIWLFIYIIYFILNISFAFSAKSLKKEYLEEAEKLSGLEKYLKEYSLIKDRYPIEIHLWEKYLVFASLFGIADKVSKEIKEELIKDGYSEDSIYINYPVYSMAIHSTYISSSISSSTGTSSSGGSSGGGSGGGGRWWPVAVVLFNINLLKHYNLCYKF